LVIQFRLNRNSKVQEQAAIERGVGIYCDLDYIDALDKSLPWFSPENILKNYDGVILGGSAEFYFDGERHEENLERRKAHELLSRLTPLFDLIFARDIPTFGICFGHQLLGAYVGVGVKSDKRQAKVCSHEVSLLSKDKGDKLLAGLPESFAAHYGHKDVLCTVPEEAELLLDGGERCRVPALRYKNNIYTTQFHPELNFEDMVDRIENSAGYLPEGTKAEDIFVDDRTSNLMLQNFGKLVALQMQEKVCDS